MPEPDLEMLGTVIDLVVVLVAISLFAYAFFRGYLTWHVFPGKGVTLIASGLFLAMLAHVSAPLIELAQPAGAEAVDALALGLDSNSMVHWMLSRLAFGLIAVGLLIGVLSRKRLESRFDQVQAQADDARRSEAAKESRLRHLFANSRDSVYCFRFDEPLSVDLPVEKQIRRSRDAYLEDCNVVFAREFGANDPSEVVGMRFGDLDSSNDEAAHERYFRTFIANGYRLDNYDMAYEDPEGNDCALFVNVSGDVHDRHLHRIWAIESNVLDMRLTKAKLERRDQFQKLVATISSRLVKVADDDASDEISECLGEVCRYVGAERSFMFWIDRKTGLVKIENHFSPTGNPFGETVRMDDFDFFLRKLEKGESVRIDDTSTLPVDARRDKASLESYGIKSIMVLPLTVAGDVKGGMTMSRIHEQRDWTDEEVKEVRVIAELFTSFVTRLESRRALDQALTSLQNATDRLEAENVYLREEIELSHRFDDIIGHSRAVMRCLKQVEQVAPTRATVLILGETGTGKELVARAIHELSERKDRPLVKVNCAALPSNLVESELFGYEKGAFTGAESSKRGRFDLANGSTLFLDEIGEIPIELQAKLLRVLQEGEFERLGGTTTVKVDVRLVVATNQDLGESVARGTFRSDLYYRINTFPIEMPALRDRGDDIQLLAEHFVGLHSQRLGREIKEISAEMMRQLRHYSWPGNVRELEGIVQRALISSRGPVLKLAEPLVAIEDTPQAAESTGANLRLMERDHIVSILEEAKWKISGRKGAAVKLGIPPSTLRSKMKKLSIERPQ